MFFQTGGGPAGQEQRRLQVRSHKFVPAPLVQVRQRGWIERGGVVHQGVQPVVESQRRVDQGRACRWSQQVGLGGRGGTGAGLVEFIRKLRGFGLGAAVVNDHIELLGMEVAGNDRADAPGGACDQHCFIRHGVDKMGGQPRRRP